MPGNRYISAILIIFLILASFQNCTSGGGVGFSSSEKSILTANENAGTFDGKPDPGTYIRSNPDLVCPNGNIPKNVQAVIEVTSNTVTLVKDNCENVNFPISAQSSPTNKKYLTFTSGVFEKITSFQDWAEEPLPISETYCSFSDALQSIDVIIHANTALTKRNSEIYLKKSTSGSYVSPFTVTYSTNNNQISYQSPTQNFKLSIVQNAGQLSANIDGTDYQLTMNCKTLNTDPVLTVSSNNLVGRWNFDNQLSDSSGLGNTLAGLFSSYSPGHLLSGVFFDGNDDALFANPSTSLNNLHALTASIWLNPNLVSNNLQILFGKYDINDVGWFIEVNAAGGRYRLWAGFSGGQNLDIATQQGAVPNQWQNLTVTWDGSGNAGNTHFFVNGNEILKENVFDSGVGNRTDDSSTALKIGGFPGATSPFGFSGNLDEPILFNRVLSPQEIQAWVTHGPAALK